MRDESDNNTNPQATADRFPGRQFIQAQPHGIGTYTESKKSGIDLRPRLGPVI
jgi:hypothetical protein